MFLRSQPKQLNLVVFLFDLATVAVGVAVDAAAVASHLICPVVRATIQRVLTTTGTGSIALKTRSSRSVTPNAWRAL